MNITEDQKNLLNRFSCSRLSSSEAHRELIGDFENKLNPNLVSTLKEEAWAEDQEGSIAYYLIKDPDGFPMFFFSLKCGALYQPLDEVQIEARKKQLLGALGIVKQSDGFFSESDMKEAFSFIEQYRTGKYKSNDKLDELIKKIDILEYVGKDKSTDTNRHIVRVDSTHSGIELVHFCKNDNANSVWKKYNLHQPLGKVVFWFFIVPIIEEVMRNVGCKYLFLFAADGSEDGDLINYYEVELRLRRPDDIGTNKPLYDLLCVFMCEEVKNLLDFRDHYFNNFNPDIDNPIV